MTEEENGTGCIPQKAESVMDSDFFLKYLDSKNISGYIMIHITQIQGILQVYFTTDHFSD